MNREIVFRVLTSTLYFLKQYEFNRVERPDNLSDLANYKHAVETLIHLLDAEEREFIEWATATRNNNNYYDNKGYGLYHGYGISYNYPRYIANLTATITSSTVFDYIYDEYLMIMKAEKSMANVESLSYRTCDKCETRFETIDGMHRHRSRCKGDKTLPFKEKLSLPLYRGNYVGRQSKDIANGWTDGKTSEW